MRLMLAIIGALALFAIITWLATGTQSVALFHWAAMQQRAVQEAMAGSLQAIRAGNPLALAGLCLLAATYGFLHAVGPGHGKVILGSTALTGEVPLRRMLAIGLAASLAQSGTAILLVGAGFGAAAMSGGSASLTEDTLADISRWAIAAIGALMLWQGGRRLWHLHRPPDATQHHHHHGEGCSCGHAHGPTVEQVTSLGSTREAAALILSIAIRPCTGALVLLTIAFGLRIPLAGILATLAMGAGTAALNAIAIFGGDAIGRMSALETRLGLAAAPAISGAALRIAGGLIIIVLPLGFGL
ncbi:hypothetical protein LZ190_10460 [Rhodovulum sulfidophilum]|nr:hypothetical protein [Rhodovulum sulfidophilum]